MSTIKLGIIGLGSRGADFLHLYRSDNRFEVKAVCDVNPDRLQELQDLTGLKLNCFTNMDAMLAKCDIDAVIVATNDQDHVEPILKSLAAGKHVMAEKPLCQSVEEAQEIAVAAKNSKGIFMIGFELRNCVVFETMKRLLSEGRIGEIKVAHAFDNVSVGGNYFFHDPKHQKAFYKSLLLQKATHSLDLLNWLVDSEPVKVYATGGMDFYGRKEEPTLRCGDCDRSSTCPYYINATSVQLDYGGPTTRPDYCVWSNTNDLDDNTQLSITYSSGVKATFHECHFTPDYTREFWLIGTKGKMYGFFDNPGRFRVKIEYSYDKEGRSEEWYPISPGGDHGGGDNGLMEEFYRRIVEDDKSLSPIHSAYYSTVLALGAHESIRTGMPVNIVQMKL